MNFPELLRYVAGKIDILGNLPPEQRRPEELQSMSVLLGLLIDAAHDVQKQMGIERTTLGDYLKQNHVEH